MPRISVCVPTYNGEKYLGECLDSVLLQTFTDFELLIVDDCSLDGTVDLARSYEAKDERVRVVSNAHNLGLVDNWNRCVDLAQGQWIKFVFQDDIIARECLERMYGAATATNIPLIFCRREFLFQDKVPRATQEFYLDAQSLVERVFPQEREIGSDEFTKLALYHMGRNFVGEPTVTLIEKRVFDRAGYFNRNLIVSCDKEFWIRAGIQTGIFHIATPLATFRVHNASVTSRAAASREYRMKVLDELVLLHEAVFNRQYQPLRDAAKNEGINLRKQFAKRALWAYNMARQAATSATEPDESLLREWCEVSSHFRGLTRVPLQHSILRRWDRWRRGVRSFLRSRNRSC